MALADVQHLSRFTTQRSIVELWGGAAREAAPRARLASMSIGLPEFRLVDESVSRGR